MKKQYIPIFLAIGLLVFAALFIFSEKENKAYEKYLSDELVGEIGRISHSALYNLDVLKDVIDSEKITKAQAGELETGFRDITLGTQEVSEMGEKIGKLTNYKHNEILRINMNYAYFFMRLEMEGHELKLTNEQIQQITRMKKLMQEYREVVKSTLENTGEMGTKGVPDEFSELYRKKGVTDDYWIEFLKGYEQVTDFSYQLD